MLTRRVFGYMGDMGSTKPECLWSGEHRLCYCPRSLRLDRYLRYPMAELLVWILGNGEALRLGILFLDATLALICSCDLLGASRSCDNSYYYTL